MTTDDDVILRCPAHGEPLTPHPVFSALSTCPRCTAESKPETTEQAHARGVAEGLERAAKMFEAEAAACEARAAELRKAPVAPDGYVAMRCSMDDAFADAEMEVATDRRRDATRIRALVPR